MDRRCAAHYENRRAGQMVSARGPATAWTDVEATDRSHRLEEADYAGAPSPGEPPEPPSDPRSRAGPARHEALDSARRGRLRGERHRAPRVREPARKMRRVAQQPSRPEGRPRGFGGSCRSASSARKTGSRHLRCPTPCPRSSLPAFPSPSARGAAGAESALRYIGLRCRSGPPSGWRASVGTRRRRRGPERRDSGKCEQERWTPSLMTRSRCASPFSRSARGPGARQRASAARRRTYEVEGRGRPLHRGSPAAPPMPRAHPSNSATCGSLVVVWTFFGIALGDRHGARRGRDPWFVPGAVAYQGRRDARGGVGDP
jgi:hypothetical protein